MQRSSASGLGVALYLNGGLIGTSENEEANTFANQNNQVTLQSTLNLKKDDQVWITIYYQSTRANLFDSSDHSTHFTGFMLEEEIVASL